MLLVYILVTSIVTLLAFSFSRETGKNTKFARKNANAIAKNRATNQQLGSTTVVGFN